MFKISVVIQGHLGHKLTMNWLIVPDYMWANLLAEKGVPATPLWRGVDATGFLQDKKKIKIQHHV